MIVWDGHCFCTHAAGEARTLLSLALACQLVLVATVSRAPFSPAPMRQRACSENHCKLFDGALQGQLQLVRLSADRVSVRQTFCG